MGFADPTLTVDQLSKAGVKRISVGGAMARYALAAFLKSAREMKDHGAFTFVREMAPMEEVQDCVQRDRSLTVIASAAKQSMLPHAEAWIASSLRSLRNRFAFVAGNDGGELTPP